MVVSSGAPLYWLYLRRVFFCCSSQHPIAEKHQPSIIIATARTLLCCCWWYEIQFLAQITVITGTPFRGRSKKLIDFESDKTNKTQFHLEGELLLTTIHLPKAQVLKKHVCKLYRRSWSSWNVFKNFPLFFAASLSIGNCNYRAALAGIVGPNFKSPKYGHLITNWIGHYINI